MPRVNRSYARGLPSSLRRQTSWGLGLSGLVTFSGTTTQIWATGSQAILSGLIHVRFRGSVTLGLRSGSAIGDGFSGAFGVCIVFENAFVAGVGSIPAPVTDISWDGWLVHQLFQLTMINSTHAAANQGTGGSYQRYEVDSKAMRKIKNFDIMVGVIECVETGTSVMEATLQSRVLDKLS